MILNDEIARIFRQKIIKAFFGEEWRPERPLENIGADLQNLLAGRDVAGYQYRAGRLQGLLDAQTLFSESVNEANNTESRP